MNARGVIADDLRPQSPERPWRGVALSALVHGALFAALLWGFRWEKPLVEPVAAELWASVPPPAPAAPPPTPARAPAPAPPAARVAPEPLRPDADIALRRDQERERQRQAELRQQQEKAARDKAERAEREKAERDKAERAKAEREKLEREKAEQQRLAQAKAAEAKAREAKAAEAKAREAKAAEAKARDDARQAKAAAEQEARQREANLARMMGQLGAAGGSPQGTGTATAGGPSASYAGRIVAAIKPNIVFAETISGNPAAEVEVRTGPGGTIIGRTLVRSSGRPDWDEAVLRAIDRTGTLPRDTDGRVPSPLTIRFRPRD